MTQRERVIQYLVDFGSITTLQGQVDLGVRRTENVVNDLINEQLMGVKDNPLDRLGCRIEKVWKKGTNRYGDKTTWIEYRLVRRNDLSQKRECLPSQ